MPLSGVKRTSSKCFRFFWGNISQEVWRDFSRAVPEAFAMVDGSDEGARSRTPDVAARGRATAMVGASACYGGTGKFYLVDPSRWRVELRSGTSP